MASVDPLQAPYLVLMSDIINQIKKLFRSLKRRNAFTILGVTAGIVLVGGFGLYLLDGRYRAQGTSGIVDTFWWAIVTITTVGYGDVVPHSIWGRIIGLIIMLSGVVLISLFTATIASIFVERKIKEGEGLDLSKEKDHIVICGWNENTERAIQGIVLHDKPGSHPIVLVNELEKDDVDSLQYRFKERDIHFVKGNFVMEDVLAKANIFKAQAAIIMADTSNDHTLSKADERIIFGAMTIKSMAPKVRVCAELINPENREYLMRAKVDEIVIRGESHGSLLASAAMAPGFLNMVNALIQNKDENKVWGSGIPAKFVGRPYGELSLYFKEKCQGLLIGILREKKGIQLEDILSDSLTGVDEFIRRKFEESGKKFFDGRETIEFIINPLDDMLITAHDRAVVIARENPADMSFIDKLVGPR
jgi:voltage-gated potassium channel